MAMLIQPMITMICVPYGKHGLCGGWVAPLQYGHCECACICHDDHNPRWPWLASYCRALASFYGGEPGETIKIPGGLITLVDWRRYEARATAKYANPKGE